MSAAVVHPRQRESGSAATEVDVAIVGGGMVGASFALALAGSGLSTILVESVAPGSRAQPSFDERTTALGNASRRIFEGLGIWNRIASEAAAIRTIHVSDAGRFGFARLRADEHGIDAFGYVVPNRVIGTALWQALEHCGDVRLRVPARPGNLQIEPADVRFTVQDDSGSVEQVRARLVVAADGAHSIVRDAAAIDALIEEYEQVAIVANVGADRAHDGTAYERFTPSGPLAVLPLRDGSYAAIWACEPGRAKQVLALDDARFLLELQQWFGWRAGRFVRAGTRASYPLRLTRAARPVGLRTVLIGNAAQALHPVAGQGFNLGLRDAVMLAETLVTTHSATGAKVDPGGAALLDQFARWRSGDRDGVVRFTDGLVRLFGSTRPGVGLLRNLGLLLFDLTPVAKSALARVSAGFAGPTPRLARGLPLRQPGGRS